MKYVSLCLAVLLLLCLAPMPYGFYQLVRFVSMVVFGLMAYKYYEQKNIHFAVIFGALALLFQPFFKVVLGRIIWNIVDIGVAILLIGLFFSKKDVLSK